ncbi:MAG TPA: MFS transporter [Solirubrobacteraceae bacterium]|nr:MFS transporter [Solirubrobacteraceae bacterium]
MPGRYRALLAVPGFVRLLISAVAGRLPLGMASLSILLLLRTSTHSFSVAGVAVGAFAVSEAAIAPVIGSLIDRIGMTAILVPSAVGQATLLVALVLASDGHAPDVVLVLLSAGAGACMPPVSACVRMLWPLITPDRQTRDSAYALDATAQEIVWTTGPLIVGVLAGAVSPRVAVLAAAGVSVAGTSLFVSAPATRLRSSGQAAGDRRLQLLFSPALQILLTIDVLIGLCLGATEVGLPALALDEGSRGAAGLLLSMWSIGSMIGGVVYGARNWNAPSERKLFVLLLATAATTAPLIAAWDLPSAFVLALLAGICGAPMFASVYSLLGDHAPPTATAAAFTWNTAALVAGVAGGSAAAGLLVTALGPKAAFVLSCVCALLAAALAGAGRPRLAARRA